MAFLKTPKGKVFIAVGIVAVAVLMLSQVVHRVEGSCTLKPLDQAIVRARTGGYIDIVNAREGQRVQAGDVLAQLKNEELDKRLQKVENEKRRMETQLGGAYPSGNSNQLELLKIKLRDVEERLANTRKEVADLTIVAPIGGLITTPDLQYKIGEYVAKGGEFCQILEPSTLRVSVEVEEREISAVHAGDPVAIKFKAFPNERLTANVTRVTPTNEEDAEGALNPAFRIYVDIRNMRGEDGLYRLMAGMSGKVEIDVGRRTFAEHLWDRVKKTLKTDALMF